VRGRVQDPVWVRPAFFALLGTTALLYLWNLAASGWANAYYSAAVLAGTKSWAAFFFGLAAVRAGDFFVPAFGFAMSAPTLGLGPRSRRREHTLDLGDEGIRKEGAHLEEAAAGVPFAGFYTYGEIARVRGIAGFHNQTLVVLALG